MTIVVPDDAKNLQSRPDIELLITEDTVSITVVKDVSLSELFDLLRQSGVFTRHGEYPI